MLQEAVSQVVVGIQESQQMFEDLLLEEENIFLEKIVNSEIIFVSYVYAYSDLG
jgi:hypothetical protein